MGRPSAEEIQAAPILIVDDEPINIRILEKVLAGANFINVTGTTEPNVAIDTYRQQEFDLVMLDINMPGLNGFQVMEAFAELNRPVAPPVLVMTALSDRDTRLQALNGGARDFIAKPFDDEEVISRIGNLLEMQLSAKMLEQQNVELEHAVRMRTRELERTQLDTLQRLSFAGEYRDTETGEHTIRVGLYAEHLGLEIGLRTELTSRLRHAAPMHDIGKIGIPDSILLKQGKLDPGEWEIMKTHTTIGAAILDNSESELLQLARSIASTHHEKWDGSGYPHGYAGREIPVEGRIVALADVFDALTMERPYKSAWNIGEAVDLIRESSGSHFDPELVATFINALPVLLNIRELHKDVV